MGFRSVAAPVSILATLALVSPASAAQATDASYNNNTQILQAPGYVAIVNEHIHNTRIIPIDGRPHGSIPQWVGDSRERWEGATLVVETKNFARETAFAGSSKDSSLVEQFCRVDPESLTDGLMERVASRRSDECS